MNYSLQKFSFLDFFQKIFFKLNQFRRHVFVRIWFLYILFLLIVTSLLIFPFVWINPDIHSYKFLDSFYLVTSAFSTTGLKVRDIGTDMTFWGQLIIFLLMLMGGIGLLFFKILFFQMMKSLFKFRLISSINLKNSQEQIFERGYLQISKTRRMLRVSFCFLLFIELVGFLTLFALLFNPPSGQPFHDFKGNASLSFWNALFHSVSATNNAGFDIFPGESLSYFVNSFPIQIVFAIQFILGGIGFIVFLDIWDWFLAKKKHRSHRFGFFTKFSLYMYTIVVIFGLSIIFLTEGLNRESSTEETNISFVFRVVFNTLSCRSAGFSTVDIKSEFTHLSRLIMIILMWIGCSPLSTGGGIKTSIFAILLLSLLASRDAKNNILVGHRSIDKRAINVALATVFFSIILIFFGTFLSLLFSKYYASGDNFVPERHDLTNNLFYFTSALGNVGLNAIPIADQPNWKIFKLYTIFLMLFGQIGISGIFLFNQRNKQRSFTAIPIEIPL